MELTLEYVKLGGLQTNPAISYDQAQQNCQQNIALQKSLQNLYGIQLP